MLGQLFPEHADNTYRGHKLALWFFGLVVLMKLGISLATIFNGYNAATSADGIPLDTYSHAAVQTVLSLFALLGLAQLLISLLCVLVLFRYRSLISLMFVVLLVLQLGRKLILYFLPIVRTGTPPGSAINLALLALMVVGLALSLRSKDQIQELK